MSQTIAFVPCRGGSKRIPRKSTADVGGESLLSRAISGARRAELDRVVVSTDDVAIAFGVSVLSSVCVELHDRPASLATDHAQIESAIAHWLGTVSLADDDVVALLQPTSPFRRPETIRKCVDLVRRGCDSAVTVTLDVRNTGRVRGLYDPITGDDIARRTIWDRPVQSRPRSQDARAHAMENGVCWAFTVGHFRKTGLRMGGREASVPTHWLEAVEVDTPLDLEIARALAPHAERLLAMEGT